MLPRGFRNGADVSVAAGASDVPAAPPAEHAADLSSRAQGFRSRRSSIFEIGICFVPVIVALAYAPALYAEFDPLKRALYIVLAAALFAAAAAARRLSSQPRTWFLLLAAYAGVAVVAWMASDRRDMGLQPTLAMVAGPMLAWVATSVMRDRRTMLLEVIAATGAFQAAITVAEWRAALDPFQPFGRALTGLYRDRAIGTLGNPDALALFVAASIPALVTLIADRSRTPLQRFLWFGLAIVDFGAIAASACRTGLSAALLGGAIVLWVRRPALARKTGITFAAVLLMAAVILVAVRVADRRNPLGVEAGSTTRVFTWEASLWHRPGNPLLGAGPGTFHWSYLRREGLFLIASGNPAFWRFPGDDNTPNNDFLQALLDTGWLGLAAFVGVLGWWVRTSLRVLRASADPRRRETTIAALGAIAGFCVAALVESPLHHMGTRALFWVWLALPISYVSEDAGALPSSSRAATEGGCGRVAFIVRSVFAVVVMVAAGFVAARPVVANYWIQRGRDAEFQNRIGEAVRDMRRALSLDPTDAKAHFFLERELYKSGDSDAATRAAIDAERWNAHPQVVEFHVKILARAGRLDEALRVANEGLRIYPWAGVLRGQHDRLFAQIGRTSK